MKLGIIGPQVPCDMIAKSLHEIDDKTVIHIFSREQVKDCVDVIEECEKMCDAILFTGCAIESYIKEKYDLKKPYTSVEKSIISMSGAFLEMQKKNMELDAFSIDVVENQVIEDLLDAFKISARNIYSCCFQDGVDEQSYVDWHIQLQEEGKTNVALTAFMWVYQELQKKGYHVIYLGPTRAMVRSALERLQNEYALNRAEDAMIAVEILQLTNYERIDESYYTGMLKKADIEKHIIQYVKSIQAAIFSYGMQEYIVFCNAGGLDNGYHKNKILTLQQEVEKTGIVLNVGIGTGVTAYKAEMNARKALEYTLKQAKKEIYLIDGNDTLIDLMRKENKFMYEVISSDPKIQELATKTGLSANSILKIIAIAQARKSFVFDANELAECLDVTVRTAHRMMNKIMNAGLGKVYAKETSVSGGRPKTWIELLFQEV
ncbi:GTP cyclohydrolase IIa [Clostridium sp.]|uniref:GTP cyclohydrolase IIa n=3 Tax=Clostridium sp. TaxID=1506 RepID=UPI002A8D2603|nr:GTP cyclohydrolase IIa [Clostridium sp.]